MEPCEIAGVSRSGYYKWLSTKEARSRRETQDRKDFQLILDVYNYRGYAKGSRSIYMHLRARGHIMNRKKIQRLMNKYSLFCPIRKANPYRRMQKATKASTYTNNKAQRKWKNFAPGQMIQTDITYTFFSENNSQKAYLSTMRDACTKEILSYVLSDNLKENFVLETVDNLIKNHGSQLSKNVILHSDQGVHYSALEYVRKLKKFNIKRSMSRRGNCWDNAPQESFFGHMKDEIDISQCKTFEDLKLCIDDYMDYYNNDRYQWELCKMTPNEYNKYLRKGNYIIPRKDKGEVKVA